MYQYIISGAYIRNPTPLIIPGIIPMGTLLEFIDSTNYTPFCDLSVTSYDWIYVAWLLLRFGVNPNRLCIAKITPKPNAVNPTTLHMKFSLGPPAEPLYNNLYINNQGSAECIKNMIFAWVNQFANNGLSVEQWILTEKSKTQNNLCLNGFTSKPYQKIEYSEDIDIKSIGKISNIKIENYTSDDTIEHITNPVAVRGSSSPSTFFDYLFMYSLPIAFLGSVGYALLAVTQLDMSSILINKNIVIAMNIYIALCGLFSFCMWYNIDITNVSIGGINISDIFSIAVVKPDINA